MIKTFDRADMIHIKNFNGQVLNILTELDLQEELARFNEAIEKGTYSIVDEMMRLIIDYPKTVKIKLGESAWVIGELFLKMKSKSFKLEPVNESELYTKTSTFRKLEPKPFDHADMQNIKNYSGQNENYPNNIPKILNKLGKQKELKKFNEVKKEGTYSIVDEIWRLVKEYPEVKEKFEENTYKIIKALYLKSHIEELNKNIGDSKNKCELQDVTEDEETPSPYEKARTNELAAELPNLSKQLRKLCITFFEKEFEGESEYIDYIKDKDFPALCDELFEYTKERTQKTKSVLFTEYRKVTGKTNDSKIGSLHTRFAVKIDHIFEHMKENPEIRRIHNESEF